MTLRIKGKDAEAFFKQINKPLPPELMAEGVGFLRSPKGKKDLDPREMPSLIDYGQYLVFMIALVCGSAVLGMVICKAIYCWLFG